MLNSDFIITLEWPEGKIASVESWYDKILELNRKYKIGHTAVILINSLTQKKYTIMILVDMSLLTEQVGFVTTKQTLN